jgi:predicted nucleic acid-binding protein
VIAAPRDKSVSALVTAFLLDLAAAAQAFGCRDLYTEDMSHGRQVEGILIINPSR